MPRETSVPLQYNNKLLEFQKRIQAIPKDSTNPFYKSTYFDVNTVIDTIKPILNEVGLVVLQPFDCLSGKNILLTQIWDGDKTLVESHIMLPEITDVQKFGAAITYFRRYALVSLLLLQGEEDDEGNTASKPNPAIRDTRPPQVTKASPLPPTMSNGANISSRITQKQAMFIKSLRTQNGMDQISDEDLRAMSGEDASKEIKKLQDYKTDPTIQIEKDDIP